ncbi:hypothetical protein ACT7C5_13465 [Bacillus pacificus]
MRKISVLPAFIITFVCMLAFLVMPYGKVSAQLADGTYDINYVIQKRKMIQLQWQMIILKNQLS